MIGHWLKTLDNDALDRILTRVMQPGGYRGWGDTVGPCLVGTVCDSETLRGFDARLADNKSVRLDWQMERWGRMPRHFAYIEAQYDGLCKRFGVARTNAAIRSRALAILASRVPRPPVPAPATKEVVPC